MNRPNPAVRTDPDPDVAENVAEHSRADGKDARLHHARLVMRDGRRFGALTPQGATWVTPAAGCLLQPEIGDLALVSLAAGQGYILTVLERGEPDAMAQMELPGGLALSLPAGKLEVRAAGGVSLDAGPGLAVNAQQAAVTIDQADIACRSLSAHGEESHSNWARRTEVSVEHLAIATRQEAHIGESVRRVAGHEDISAGSQRTVAAEDWSVQAESADLKARDRVAVDAASVQIG